VCGRERVKPQTSTQRHIEEPVVRREDVVGARSPRPDVRWVGGVCCGCIFGCVGGRKGGGGGGGGGVMMCVFAHIDELCHRQDSIVTLAGLDST